MKGITNTIRFFQENWTNIVIILSFIISSVQSVRAYIKKVSNMTKEQQVDAALVTIKEELLDIMGKAEINWSGVKKSGKLKNSDVINRIYEKHPELRTYLNQEKLIETLTTMIDENMDKLNDLFCTMEPDDVKKLFNK